MKQKIKLPYKQIIVHGSVILMLVLESYNIIAWSLWYILLPLWLPILAKTCTGLLDYMIQCGD